MTDNGDIAQLGERLNGIQEVSGSIPLISTRNDEPSEKSEGFFAKYKGFASFDVKRSKRARFCKGRGNKRR
jgi:hypothetical protein